MGLVGLGVVLRVMSDAAPAQQANGERPARGDERRGDPQIHFLSVRGEEGAAGRTCGKHRREDRHRRELRLWAGMPVVTVMQGKVMRPAKSCIAFPVLVEEISRSVYAELDAHAVR